MVRGLKRGKKAEKESVVWAVMWGLLCAPQTTVNENKMSDGEWMGGVRGMLLSQGRVLCLFLWKSNWPADFLFSFLLFKLLRLLSVSVLVNPVEKLKWNARRYVGARASEMPHWLVSFQSALSDLTPSYSSASGEIERG